MSNCIDCVHKCNCPFSYEYLYFKDRFCGYYKYSNDLELYYLQRDKVHKRNKNFYSSLDYDD